MIGSRSKPAFICCRVSGDEKLVTSHEAWTYYGDLTIRLRCGLEVRDSQGLYHASGSCCDHDPGKSGSGRRHVVHPGESDRFAGALCRLPVLYISILCVPTSLDTPPVAFGFNNHDRSKPNQRSLQQLPQSPYDNCLKRPDLNTLASSIMCYQIESGAASSTESWRPCLTEQNLRLHSAVHVQVSLKAAQYGTRCILTTVHSLPMISNNNTEMQQHPASAMNPMTETRKTCKTSPGNELHRSKRLKYTAAALSRVFSPCKNHYRGYQHPPSQTARTARPQAVAVHDQTRQL
jgi:hypothetical protein